MSKNAQQNGRTIARRLKTMGVELFGFADLSGVEPRFSDETGQMVLYPRAVSFALLMNPQIMAAVRGGPHEAYAEEYNRVNGLINEIGSALQAVIRKMEHHARAIPASERTDPVAIKGEFPHKTAATLAGLGWIGKSAMLITKQHGPWLRLGTVLTNLPLLCATPVIRTKCGLCTNCVAACPAKAIAGHSSWYPGLPRKALLDAQRCDDWKKEHYPHLNHGHVCGICAAVCPFGR